MSIKNLVTGNYYHVKFNGKSMIIKFSGNLEGQNHFINTNNEYRIGSCCTAPECTFHSASKEQIDLLDKYISTKQINNTYLIY